ncbi:unnamed protein product [Caenorhabditis angaria]|uniref:NF-kappa-B-activating protein C-terminal domain-containing protein n=1 Tax=Caenorhabditis angaria TaxID=860376 RepID=A0A9P1I5S6_9PELO|nr:unnamed protein product [Caenorhabditis angaria]
MYSGQPRLGRGNSRSSSLSRKENDKPLWNKRNSSDSRSSSSSSSKSSKSSRNRSKSPRKRSPIRAPSPENRRSNRSPRRRRKRSSTRSSSSKRSRSRSIHRRRSPAYSRSPVRRRRTPIRNRLSRPNQSRSPVRRRKSRTPPRRSRSPPRRNRSPPSQRRSRSPPPKNNYRRRRSETPDEKQKEETMWKKRRERRTNIQLSGQLEVWAKSPSQREIEETYRIKEEDEEIQADHVKKGEKLKADRAKAKKKEERKRNKLSEDEDESSSDSEVEKTKKKKKKEKKHKKEKKSKKSKKEKKVKKEKKIAPKNEESSDEWEERPNETNGVEPMEEDGSYSPGPAIPEHIKNRDDIRDRLNTTVTSYGKDLLKGEGAGMAAYVARGERIPRRGEIGLSSGEIEQYEKWGYVMSGSRHKAMEATRLRKENQILTAEEKRLLSGVSMDAKKKKEEAVMDQFRSLIENKNKRA